MQSLPQEALLAAFGQLAVSRNLIAQVRRGAHCKAGGLWGASAALLLTTLAREHKGALLVLTADDVDSMMLQNDMSAFGATSHVLVREEEDDDGAVDASTRSDRQRALQRFANDGAPLIASIEAMLQPAATPRDLRKAKVELRVGQQGAQQRPRLLPGARRQARQRAIRQPVVSALGEYAAEGFDDADGFFDARSGSSRLAAAYAEASAAPAPTAKAAAASSSGSPSARSWEISPWITAASEPPTSG